MRTVLRLAAIDGRRRIGAAVVLALVIGASFGVALTALAGARRNDTAYARLLRYGNASDVLVNPNFGVGSELDVAKIAKLPHVDDVGIVWGLYVAEDRHGKPRLDDIAPINNIVSDGRETVTLDRPKVIEGRMPRDDVSTEVAVSPELARSRHLHVGSVWVSHVFTDLQLRNGSPTKLPTGRVVRSRVVGILEDNYSVVSDEATATPTLLFGGGARRFHAEAYLGIFVKVHDAARDVPVVEREISALVPAAARGKGDTMVFQTRSDLVARVARITRPQTVALGAFALVSGLAALLVAAQALVRHLEAGRDEVPTLSALGATRPVIFGLLFVRVAAITVASAVVAVAVAATLSPVMPLGLARQIEPHPGAAINVALLLLAEAASVAVLLAGLSIPMWRIAGRPSRPARRTAPLITRILRPLQGHPSAALGARSALASGDRAAASGSALFGTSLAVLWLVAATVFAASMSRFVDTPPAWGWHWDAMLSLNTLESGPNTPPTDARVRVEALLHKSRGIVSTSLGTTTEVTFQGHIVTTIAMTPGRDGMPATITAGRAPRSAHEVALGVRTMRLLHTSIGSTIRATDPRGRSYPVRVVGRAVFAGLASYAGEDPTSLGSGALITMDGHRRYGVQLNSPLYFVDYRAGLPPETRVALQRLKLSPVTPAVSKIAEEPQRPSDVKGITEVRGTPYVLAAVLGVLAMLTVGHTLTSDVRRRRREFAVLKALGFSRWRVATIVAWHATTVTVVGLVIGMPLGVIVGLRAWALTAHQLGVPSEPVVPGLVIAAAAGGIVLIANLLAAIPGWTAARTPAAVLLHDE